MIKNELHGIRSALQRRGNSNQSANTFRAAIAPIATSTNTLLTKQPRNMDGTSEMESRRSKAQ